MKFESLEFNHSNNDLNRKNYNSNKIKHNLNLSEI